jgi:hypothetical protein
MDVASIDGLGHGGARLGADTLDADTFDVERAEPAESSVIYREPPLGMVDRLAVAGRAAARVACEQAPALESAARLLRAAAQSGGCIWITGLGADDHRRRLHARGQRALVWPDRERLPGLLGPRDVLLVAVDHEAPRWLAEAQRRRTLTIVLGGPGRIDNDHVEASLRVPCFDAGTLELAHAFIVLALCADAELAGPAA